jgi:hydroxymethylpyrimidine pyrophosphatase-like HAD family hydrolase
MNLSTDRNAMKYKLLALDIDGTVADRRGEVLPEVADALNEVCAAGIAVCLATGRSYVEAAGVWRQLKLKAPHQPMIVVGGALVSEAATGRTLYQRTIPQAVAQELIAGTQKNQSHRISPLQLDGKCIFDHIGRLIGVGLGAKNEHLGDRAGIKGVSFGSEEGQGPIKNSRICMGPTRKASGDRNFGRRAAGRGWIRTAAPPSS